MTEESYCREDVVYDAMDISFVLKKMSKESSRRGLLVADRSESLALVAAIDTKI